MEILNLEEALHRYMSDNRNLSNWNSNTSGFIPSFREVKSVYSNVEGGIGIFAGYNRSEITVKVK